MAKDIFALKSVCIVTGASRGLGRSVFSNFAAKFPEGSLMIGLARGTDGLEETKKLSLEKAPHVGHVIRRFDQGSLDQSDFDGLFQQCLEGRSVTDFEQAMIIHNAGSLESEMCQDMTDVNRIANYMNVNVGGVVALNAQFLQLFKNVQRKVVINISSLLAIQAVSSLAFYSTGKAARDMYFKTVAAEHSDCRVLNYAPGPLITDMLTKDILQGAKDSEVRKQFQGMMDSALQTDTTVQKLARILQKDDFTSGDHIDFYDVE